MAEARARGVTDETYTDRLKREKREAIERVMEDARKRAGATNAVQWKSGA